MADGQYDCPLPDKVIDALRKVVDACDKLTGELHVCAMQAEEVEQDDPIAGSDLPINSACFKRAHDAVVHYQVREALYMLIEGAADMKRYRRRSREAADDADLRQHLGEKGLGRLARGD